MTTSDEELASLLCEWQKKWNRRYVDINVTITEEVKKLSVQQNYLISNKA